MTILRKISVVLLVDLLSCNRVDKDKSVTAVEKDRPSDKIQLKELNDQLTNLKNAMGK